MPPSCTAAVVIPCRPVCVEKKDLHMTRGKMSFILMSHEMLWLNRKNIEKNVKMFNWKLERKMARHKHFDIFPPNFAEHFQNVKN